MNWVGTVSNITVGRFGGGGGAWKVGWGDSEISPSSLLNLAIANESDCVSLNCPRVQFLSVPFQGPQA